MASLLITTAISAAITIGAAFLNSNRRQTQQNTQEGPRLQDMQITSAAEGAAVKRMWGRIRLGGEVIWATKFLERVVTTTSTSTTSSSGGGKGGGGGGGGSSTVVTTTTNYYYSVSFAVAFCEGADNVQLGRVWADGKIMNLSSATTRFYKGTQTQNPDPLISTKEGAGTVPAFRGISYLVFENLELADYGNRIPQITAEIIKPLESNDPDDVENALQSIAVIPSAGEFVLDTTDSIKDDGYGNAVSENRHNGKGVTDFVASMDNLEAVLPNLDKAMLVVSWFGSDLRCGNCTVRPKVEIKTAKYVVPKDWQVSNLVRSSADTLATSPDYTSGGRPAYGGTPSDISVRHAISDLKDRGVKVVFYPFLLMDIPPGNTLTDPYTGAGEQPSFPWRGRVTCSPAPGVGGTPDKTAAAATQVAAFVGTVENSDYGSWNGSALPYTGPTEWSYRRMILHYANLVKDLLGAGDVFIIGSEMRGMTGVRSSSSAFPFVTALIDIAADVSAVLNSNVKVSYAADWSEYHSYRPTDGSGDVYFHLDPLWASSDIDFIGIDNYLPISDWRDGDAHLDYDADAGITNIYNKDYLEANIEGGEYFDWYYANDSDRTNQVRTPITDTTYGKPWVYGNKNIRGWWSNAHYNRPAGVESGSPTAYTPSTKPIWFTEFGCSASDKATNQPNVFIDPKSSESFAPYFSNRRRDDFIQRRYLEVMLAYWRDNGGSMIDEANMIAWTWDARPYPEFPFRLDVWSDGINWQTGHWLTGRLGVVPLGKLVSQICETVGLDPDTDINTIGLNASDALVRGYMIDSIMAPRDMLTPLSQAYSFDAYESDGQIIFTSKINPVGMEIPLEDFVTSEGNIGGFALIRAQESELPRSIKVTFIDEENDFNVGGADAKKTVGDSMATTTLSLPIVLPQQYARSLGDTLVQEAWIGRDSAELILPPSYVALEPGDIISTTIKNRPYSLRVHQIDIGAERSIEAVAFDPTIFEAVNFSGRSASTSIIQVVGQSKVAFMDLPLITGEEIYPWSPRFAAYQSPWPGAVNIYRDDLSGGFNLNTQVIGTSLIGELEGDLYSGAPNKWDNGNSVYVKIYDPGAEVASLEEGSVLNGANAVAIENQDGEWEIIQFVNAELLGQQSYRLSQLLRGQLGTASAMRNFVPTGNRVVFLNPNALGVLRATLNDRLQTRTYRYGPNGIDQDEFQYQQRDYLFQGIGMRPYSPCGLKAVKDYDTDDIALRWIRRTRFGGDNWETEEVPLNEEYERYTVEIMDGPTVVRTEIVNNVTDFLYTATMQTADFGAPTGFPFVFRVYQMSSIFGRGAMAEHTTWF